MVKKSFSKIIVAGIVCALCFGFQVSEARSLPQSEMKVGGIGLYNTLGYVTSVYGEPTSKEEYAIVYDRTTRKHIKTANLDQLKGALGSGMTGHFVEYTYGTKNNKFIVTARAVTTTQKNQRRIYSQLDNKKLEIISIDLTANNLKTPSGIQVGKTILEVEQTYGKPSNSYKTPKGILVYSYSADGKSPNEVYFYFSKGKVQSILISGLT